MTVSDQGTVPDKSPVPDQSPAPDSEGDPAAGLGPGPARLTAAGRVPGWRLVLLSFLTLFIELALIRWTAANDVYLASLTNFVLLGSFLGIGVGFLSAKARANLLSWVPGALLALVAFVLAFPVAFIRLFGPHQLAGGFGLAPLPEPLSLAVIFVLTVAVMAGLGQGVARAFTSFAPLDAYRLDIAGSIAGILAFSVLSFLGLPPVAWGLVAAAGLLVVIGASRCRRLTGALVGAAVAAMVLLLGLESLSATTHWSPYDKVKAVAPPGTHGVLAVSANNIPHQTLYPLATLARIEPFYFFPYRHLGGHPLNDVLVIGAGTGNDVAAALQEGARHVDAVEIDPVLLQLGRDHHPNHPYQDPRVTTYVNDGRAYLQSTQKRYDLILFALPDSLTLLNGQSNLRLENYLLTVQSMGEIRSHLKPGGTFSMYNYYQPFLLDRYATTLQTVYGTAPCAEVGAPLAGRRQAVLTIGTRPTVPGCATPWHGSSLAPATDDHPFPYLRTPSIPSLYLWVLGAVLAASLVLVRAVGGRLSRMAAYVDLACMGAAFSLLETKNIVQFALLFGTTWFVNSLVFAGVLVSVLAAVEVARHVRLPRPWVLYAALGTALVVAWAVPQESLLGLAPVFRFVAAIAIAFAPIFLANLVFAQRFRDVASSTVAFAANLLGAMIGGMLEYLALVTGYRLLLVLIAGLYGLAWLSGRSRLSGRLALGAQA